jgi:nickel transport protein
VFRFLTLLSASTALALSATAVSAHGAWLEARQGNLVVVYGHGASDEAYDATKVTALTACDAAAVCTPLTSTVSGGYVVAPPPEGAVAVGLTFDNGFWSQDAAGEWHNVPKTEVEGAVTGGQYVKYATHLLGHFEGALTPLGHPLEIVPQADPGDMAAGDMLPVQVLLNGAPLAGAEIIADYINDSEVADIVTGADGIAMVPVANNGQNLLMVFHSEPYSDPAVADEIGHAAALGFTVHVHFDE